VAEKFRHLLWIISHHLIVAAAIIVTLGNTGPAWPRQGYKLSFNEFIMNI